MTEPTEAPAPERYEYAPIDSVFPSKTNPRRAFPKEPLEELAESVRVHGIIEPFIVIDRGAQGYEIYAGERRYRAAKMAGLPQVPVIVRAIDNGEAAVMRLVENIQREDLSPLDLAAGYEQLVKKHGLTVDQVGEKVHKSKRSVYATMALLKLVPDVKKALESGEINATVGSVLGGVKPIFQRAAMNMIPPGSSVATAIDIVTNFHPESEKKKVERAKRGVTKAKREVKKAKAKVASLADKKREAERAIEKAALVIVTQRVHDTLFDNGTETFAINEKLVAMLIRAGANIADILDAPPAFCKVRNVDLSTIVKRKHYADRLKDYEVFPAWLEAIVATEYGGVEEATLNAILKFCGLPKYGEMLKEARKQAINDANASALQRIKDATAERQSKKAK